MKKYLSLIKASMTEGMNIFKISTKKNTKFSKVMLPVILFFVIMGAMFSYSEAMIEQLIPVNMGVVVLTTFILVTSVLTLIEGVYKSGGLLFNCKDDNLLLSLPLRKSTVLFIRIFKFYIFELLYNSMFLIPAMVSYAIHLNPGVEFYIISFIGLLLFPIIPIIVSCVIGTFITYISSKFKGKNIIQTLLTVIVLLGIMYFSYNFNGFITNIADKAVSINEIITRIYYPAGAFVELITSYSSLKLLEFVFINLVLFFVIIAILGKFYFKTNSGLKSVRTANDNKNIKIKSHSPIGALIKKELSRFINSPVFVSNAGFGLILFIIGCILIAVKFEEIAQSVVQSELSIQIDYIKSLMPLLLFGFICMSSFMTSITSSMISLEGKSLNILKSLPVKPYTIIKAKIITAIIIMIPFIIIGDIIIFVRFSFDILSMILILLTSIILPLLSETFGIIINLKYPRMDAKNDTEVVKQSMSSTICVFTGIGMVILNVFLIAMAIQANISNYLTILVLLFVYSMICMGLLALLNKNSEKDFNNISV